MKAGEAVYVAGHRGLVGSALVSEMVVADRELAKRDALIAREGFKVYRYRE